ncbi:hypothetical protein DPMN_155635 [Dreissena polymorpha]|uniref:Uncharacterized protein n=1 Tax=Dreissena polymorpha TaxID=45954 RepID=A0A9D4FNB1_DREPO|nr:hypothetical protein DPMN_155635 [Dreissena polymorpha]
MSSTVVMLKYNAYVFNIVYAQEDQLRCRLCNDALELRDCTQLAMCDNRTEECFMDQVLMATFSNVYRGGCRSKDVSCKLEQQNCNFLRFLILNTSQCYFCDLVSNPQDCITITTCNTDQIRVSERIHIKLSVIVRVVVQTTAKMKAYNAMSAAETEPVTTAIARASKV